MAYNTPFFNTLTTLFLMYKKKYGEEEALKFFEEFFSTRLKGVYDKMGFQKGNPQDFARVVGENDRNLGLKVEFVVEKNKIIYRFFTDPFPHLKGEVDPITFDSTYMKFKVSYLLGDWKLKTTKHLWNSDECTEHVIERL